MRYPKLTLAVIVAAALAGSGALAATPIADFELNGSLANTGSTGTIVNNGGTLGSTGISFAANQGPTVSGLSALSAYTIDTSFHFNDSGRYFKIVDLSNPSLTSDTGIYSLNQELDLYPSANTPTAVFTPGVDSRLTISRTSGGLVTGYVNNVPVLTYDDSSSKNFVFPSSGTVAFFQDDIATSKGEADAGFVDYIRIYDSAVTPDQASPASPVAPPVSGAPEPASWLLMLTGVGSLGGWLRRTDRRARMATSRA